MRWRAPVLGRTVLARGDLFVTPHVLFEVLRGIPRARQPGLEAQRFNSLRSRFRVLPFDAEAARLAARMAQFLDEKGSPIPHVDLFIAATAIIHGDGLVVTDDEHFRNLAPFGLTVVRP